MPVPKQTSLTRAARRTLACCALAYAAVLCVAAAPTTANPIRDTLAVERVATGSTADWDGHAGILRPRSAWRAGTFDTTFSTIDTLRAAASPVASQQCGEEGAVIGDLNGDGRGDLAASCQGTSSVLVWYRDPASGAYPGTESETLTGAGGCAYGLRIVDLNADGRLDVIGGCPWRWTTGSEQGGFVYWLRLADNTGFDAARIVTEPVLVTGSRCGHSLDVGNINGDGWPDVVLGCSGDDTAAVNGGAVVVFTGSATGFTWESRTAPSGVAVDDFCGRGIALGDFTGDGLDEVALGCPSDWAYTVQGRLAVLYRNAGNTAFSDTPTFLARGGNTDYEACGLGVESADFNADGLFDLVTGCPAADFSGPIWDAGPTDVFYSTGPGFGPASDRFWSPTPTAGTYCGDYYAVGDANGDGRPDIATGCIGDGGTGVVLAVRRVDNSGFEAPRLFQPTVPQSGEGCGTSVGMGDVDGDGRDEIAIGCFNHDSAVADSGRVHVFRVDPSTESSITGADAGDRCGITRAGGLATVTGDVDGDGLDDIVQSCERADPSGLTEAGRVHVRESRTGLWRTIVAPTPAAGDRCGAGVAVGDLDSDGRDDIAVGCTGRLTGGVAGGGVEVYLRRATNDGFDHHASLRLASPAAGDACGIAVEIADADGDRRPDVAFSCYEDDDRGSNAGTTWYARRATSSSFAPLQEVIPTTLAAGDECGAALDTGDVDGDGGAELTIGCGLRTVGGQAQAGHVLVMRRRADGTGWDQLAALAKATPAAYDHCAHHALGDFDGDGLRDVAMSCHDDDTYAAEGGRTYVFRSTGGGAFATPAPITQTSSGGAICGMPTIAADVNLDGRDDVLVGCRGAAVGGQASAGRVHVLVRNAANTDFEAPIILENPTPTASDECGDSLAVGNVRPGGRPDVIAGCSGDDTGGSAAGNLVEFRNRSAGSFTSSQTLRTGSLASGTGILSATVTVAAQRHGLPAPQLYLSADGGTSWEAATSGVSHAFTTTGTDLRARIDMPLGATTATRLSYVHDLHASWTTGAVPTVTLVAPADGAGTTDTTPTLRASFQDADVGNTGTIEYQVCGDAGCTSVAQSGSSASGIAIGSEGPWAVPSALASQTWWWRARAIDSTGLVGAWSATRALDVPASISLSVDTASVSLGTLLPGSDRFGSFVASVTTDSADGWSLSATDASDTEGADGPGTAFIPDWTGTGATPSTWPAGSGSYVGVTVRDAVGGRLAKWGSGTGTAETDVTNNRYAGLQSTTATVLHQRSTYATAAQPVTVTVRANASGTQAPGTYTSTVVLTAVALP